MGIVSPLHAQVYEQVFSFTEARATDIANTPNKGDNPSAGLVQGIDGSFYGTTARGGTNSNFGTVFKMTPTGVLTTLFDFFGPDDNPIVELIEATDGNLYGTTSSGIIYRLIMPGKPPTLAPLAPDVQITVAFGDATQTRTSSSAVIQAQANARGSTTSVSLEWGLDGGTFPNSVLLTTNLTGFQTRLLGTTLGNLTKGATYQYRFRAVSSAGTTVTPVQSFLTLAEPLVTILPASEITPTSARFNGTVNARNFDTTVAFEWGTDGNSFPNSAPAIPGTVTGNSNVPVSAAVAGFPEGGTIFYRLRATNAAGTVISGAHSFSTVSVTTTALGDSDVGIREVTFRATINTFGQTASVKFKYWADSAPATIFETATQTVVSNGPIEVSAELTSLQENVAYSYRVSVELAGTETDGGVVAFTTDTNHSPTAVPDVLFYSGQVRFNPLENDEDEDGDDPNLQIAQQLVQGPTDSGSSAIVSPDRKSITYTPGNDSAGRDSLTYRALDPYGGQADGSVRLTDFFLLTGYYSGAIPIPGNAGRNPTIALLLGATGAVSTSFMDLDGERYPLKGVFGSNGQISATFAKTNSANDSFTLSFQLLADPKVINDQSVKVIEATFQEAHNGEPSTLIAFDLVEGVVGGLAVSGTFTALIDGTTLRTVSDVQPGRVAEPVSVPGSGYVIMRINADKYRRARVVGRLPDNEPFSSGTLPPFGKSYQLAAARLYRKAAGGAFGGQVHVLDHPGEDQAATPIPLGILGDLTWRRAAWNKSPSFNKGIASRIPVEGLFYPVPGNRGLPEVLGAIGNTADATLALSGGDLPAPSAENNQLAVGLRITAPNVVQVLDPNPLKVKVKANAKTAVFSGSFVHPATRKTVRFNGAFQAAFGSAPAVGRGCFLTGDLSGSVRIETSD